MRKEPCAFLDSTPLEISLKMTYQQIEVARRRSEGSGGLEGVQLPG